jgi:S1-C subfamily serine protease
MNPIDILVVVLLLLGLVAGARAGFFGPVLGLLGAVAGLAAALLLATVLRESMNEIEQPMRGLVTILGLGALILGGEALGAGIGARMSLGLRRSVLRPIDALGGAVVGVAHVVLLVWIFGGMLAAGMAPGIAANARESVAMQAISQRLPSPLGVAGGLLALLDTTDLPPLFGGFEPLPAEPVALPADAEARALAESALDATARVASTGCGPGTSVGSGFFVSPSHAVTNAHVVAGSSGTTVTVGGNLYEAVVVAYDASADLALLHVPSVSAPSLTLLTTTPQRGSTGVALGYPGGGPLTVTAAAVTAAHDLGGPDIYGAGSHQRSVLELRAEIRRGNSGGPLVVEPGVVGGVIFGGSRLSAEVGYAIGSDEAVERLGPFIGATAAVDTGACL